MKWLGWGSKKTGEIDLERSYLRVEFLTQDQKIKKDLIINDLIKQTDNETIPPFEQLLKCSLRYTLKSPFKNMITIKDIMALLDNNTGGVKEFMEQNVEKIIIIMQKGQSLDANTYVSLYNERDVFAYNPPEILEIIYAQKSLWQRFKQKTKKVIFGFPAMMLSLFGKFLKYLFSLMGFSSTSLMLKFLPSKIIMQWIVTLITLFFPWLTPFLSIGKLVI